MLTLFHHLQNIHLRALRVAIALLGPTKSPLLRLLLVLGRVVRVLVEPREPALVAVALKGGQRDAVVLVRVYHQLRLDAEPLQRLVQLVGVLHLGAAAAGGQRSDDKAITTTLVTGAW